MIDKKQMNKDMLTLIGKAALRADKMARFYSPDMDHIKATSRKMGMETIRICIENIQLCNSLK